MLSSIAMDQINQSDEKLLFKIKEIKEKINCYSELSKQWIKLDIDQGKAQFLKAKEIEFKKEEYYSQGIILFRNIIKLFFEVVALASHGSKPLIVKSALELESIFENIITPAKENEDVIDAKLFSKMHMALFELLIISDKAFLHIDKTVESINLINQLFQDKNLDRDEYVNSQEEKFQELSNLMTMMIDQLMNVRREDALSSLTKLSAIYDGYARDFLRFTDPSLLFKLILNMIKLFGHHHQIDKMAAYIDMYRKHLSIQDSDFIKMIDFLKEDWRKNAASSVESEKANKALNSILFSVDEKSTDQQAKGQQQFKDHHQTQAKEQPSSTQQQAKEQAPCKDQLEKSEEAYKSSQAQEDIKQKTKDQEDKKRELQIAESPSLGWLLVTNDRPNPQPLQKAACSISRPKSSP